MLTGVIVRKKILIVFGPVSNQKSIRGKTLDLNFHQRLTKKAGSPYQIISQ